MQNGGLPKAKKEGPNSYESGLHGRGEGTKIFVFGKIPADIPIRSNVYANPEYFEKLI